MIDLLVTMVPANRTSELDSYFLKNVDYLSPKRAKVYIDGISDWSKSGIEVINGNWGERFSCLIQILRDFKDSDYDALLFLDSDDVLPESFQEIDEQMQSQGFDYYTICQENTEHATSIHRSRAAKKGFGIYLWKIWESWRWPFFLGPKQGIRVSKTFCRGLNWKFIEEISKRMKSLNVSITGQDYCEEVLLGMVWFYSGYKETLGLYLEFTTKDRIL